MDTLESVRMAWRSIRSHRLRSALTTLGVVIGVGAVIAFVILGASLEGAIIGDVAAGQSPTMAVSTQLEGSQSGPGIESTQVAFTEYDIQEIQALTGVEAVIPQGTVSLAGVAFRGQTIGLSTLTATTPEYFEHVGQENFSAGESFESGEREVVLNQQAATVFETNMSVGDTITITRSGGETVNATVAGVLEAPSGIGGFQPGGLSVPQIYGPVDPFAQTRLTSPATGERQRVYAQLTVVATDYEQIDAVAESVRSYLDSASDARELLPSSYETSVQTNEEFVEQIRSILNTFTGFITGIAVISLVVGAIGIANIMLVSVTERTREIGIMKAVGFQNRDVLQLFLVEAVVLGVIGSLVGILVGVLTGYGMTRVLDLPFTFPPEWGVVAVVVGIVVGVIAGLYPAWNGARIDPIEALRYE